MDRIYNIIMPSIFKSEKELVALQRVRKNIFFSTIKNGYDRRVTDKIRT